jgi:hypothetical protein
MLPAIAGSAAEREVTADEAPIRSAPFDVAPEIARVRAGDRLSADDEPQGTWRRVRLRDGRYGFVRDVDAKEAPPLPVAAPTPLSQAGAAAADVAPATTTALAPVVQLRAPAPVNEAPKAGPSLLGVMFEILPVGTLMATESNGKTNLDRSADSQFAVAVAPALDIPASPYVALGFSPKVVFRVRSEGSEAARSSTEFDFRIRLTGRVPLSPSTRAYGRVSPGYSLISVPGSDGHDPVGFIVDTSVGAEVALLPRLFAIVELGYQLGFQSSKSMTSDLSFDGSRYLHLGGGLAIGL